MNKKQDKLVNKFIDKWKQHEGTEFLSPMLHGDDIRELVEELLELEKGV